MESRLSDWMHRLLGSIASDPTAPQFDYAAIYSDDKRAVRIFRYPAGTLTEGITEAIKTATHFIVLELLADKLTIGYCHRPVGGKSELSGALHYLESELPKAHRHYFDWVDRHLIPVADGEQ